MAVEDEESARTERRVKLKKLNVELTQDDVSKSLDSSLKRHTALIKRMRQSLATDNREQIEKDLRTLSLERYVDEIAQATLEGISKCKTEKDVWSAVEIISLMHRRFPTIYTPVVIGLLTTALAPPPRTTGAAPLAPELKEKEDSARVSRQRPVLRVSAELALVGIIRDRDDPRRSGGEWIMKAMKDLLSNDPTLSSLPLLSTFLKSYSRPFLGLMPPSSVNKQQVQESTEHDSLAEAEVAKEKSSASSADFPSLGKEESELVEKEIRDRFKKMCEGYFDVVSRKLVTEHKRLQEQDRRNHEAYIRSGEIFEDRQQAYEKMTKGYEKLLSSCQTLSELLYLPMPTLPTQSQKADSILLSSDKGKQGAEEDIYTLGGKWEDEEERRFFEDLPDLKDFVPKSLLGLDEKGDRAVDEENLDKENAEKLKERKAKEEEEVKNVEEELKRLQLNEDEGQTGNTIVQNGEANAQKVSEQDGDDEDVPTPVPSPPKTPTPPGTPTLAPQGPSQMLTTLLTRLPDATNRSSIDQAAVDFAFLNSKAARKRLVRFLTQVPKNRTDLLPHYSRLVATLNIYMPDIGADLVAALEEEFRYLQRKKNVVKELSEVRQKNLAFISSLTKFRVIPTHLILHIFKVCLDDFSGTNVDNIAMLLEGCGRFLLRSDDTRERFGTMLELMRRKQSLQHFDQRQLLLLENAYYQCNPPERGPRVEKERTPMELFIRHLIYDVLSKKTIDKVLRLIRKLDWNDPQVVQALHKVFSKVWKIKFSHISLLAMLIYDLHRYHPEFSIGIVDHVLEDLRRGLEVNIYKANQQRVATMKYLGELYIYRMVNSAIIFDTFWTLVTFGHADGRPRPGVPSPLDMPDDFFRVRLICTLLDTCGMCFDRGSQKRKLDGFLTFFQLYVFTKDPLPMDVDFMLMDSLEALRPKMVNFKSFEEAAHAVDEIFNLKEGATDDNGDDSGEESGDDENEEGRRIDDDEDQDEPTDDSPINERAPSPDEFVIRASTSGPTPEEDSEFAKELAKMVTESSAESRKVDKRTAQSLWDSAVLHPSVRRKKQEDSDEEENVGEEGNGDVMKFTVLTKKGNKQQAKKLAIPAESALATHTRSAQLQDKVEQEQLKRLVLNYEQREEVEEMKALEARSRNGAVKIRYVG